MSWKDTYKKWLDVVDRFDDIEDERKVELNMYKVRWVFGCFWLCGRLDQHPGL